MVGWEWETLNGGGKHVYRIDVDLEGVAHKSSMFEDGKGNDASSILDRARGGRLWGLL